MYLHLYLKCHLFSIYNASPIEHLVQLTHLGGKTNDLEKVAMYVRPSGTYGDGGDLFFGRYIINPSIQIKEGLWADYAHCLNNFWGRA